MSWRERSYMLKRTQPKTHLKNLFSVSLLFVFSVIRIRFVLMSTLCLLENVSINFKNIYKLPFDSNFKFSECLCSILCSIRHMRYSTMSWFNCYSFKCVISFIRLFGNFTLMEIFYNTRIFINVLFNYWQKYIFFK